MIDEDPAVPFQPFTDRVMMEEGIWFSGPQWRQIPGRSFPWASNRGGKISYFELRNWISNIDSRMHRIRMTYTGCRHRNNDPNLFGPGLFVLVCSCHRRKCLGAFLMDTSEGPSTLFKILMTRWKRPPRLVWYDTVCGLDRYATYRFPYYFRDCKFLLDRFHDGPHECPIFFKFQSFPVWKRVNTARSEQFNSLLRLGDLVASLSYMRQTNFMFAIRYWIYVYNRFDQCD
jgi:hypothetical protein